MPVLFSNNSATLSERPTSEEYQTTVPSRCAASNLSAAISNASVGLLSARPKINAASAAAQVLKNCLPRSATFGYLTFHASVLERCDVAFQIRTVTHRVSPQDGRNTL